MEHVTREVIADLWPLYVSEDASADTRKLIEAFLRDDPEFARTLKELPREALPNFEPPVLSPDHELRTLSRVRKRLMGPLMMLNFALIFSGLSFGALVSDTSFDVSPRRFIATALVAVCFWTIFLVKLFKGRREVLVRIRR
jgi:hypothetical protein